MLSKINLRPMYFIALVILSAFSIYFSVQLSNGWPILIISFSAIILFNLIAVLEDNLDKYVIYCFLVQAGYVFLDMGIAVVSGKASYLAGIQLTNFLFAGALFLISIKGKSFSALKVNNYSLVGITVSALALAGLPGFNLFVGEYFLYILAFDANPLLLGICFLCSLLTLVACLKIVSHAFSQGVHEKPSAFMKFNVIALSSLCIILGIVPWIQIMIFEAIL